VKDTLKIKGGLKLIINYFYRKKVVKLISLILLFLSFSLLLSCNSTIPEIPSDQGRAYRIILVGIGEYQYIDDIGSGIPPQEFVGSILAQWKFGDQQKGFDSITYLYNEEATKTNILNHINTELSNAKEEDVSYFFFGGHGGFKNGESYLCAYDSLPSNMNSMITASELKNIFDSIKGIKVLVFDSCFCGGFIGKGNNLFLENLIGIFNVIKEDKTTITGNNYKVLVSCRSSEICQTYSYNNLISGVFTYAIIEGASNGFPADANKDSIITLQEMYSYIKDRVASLGYSQEIQVYPENDTFPIVEY